MPGNESRKFLNEFTFADLTPIDKIEPKDRMPLGSYMFDVNELIAWAKSRPGRVFEHPYPDAQFSKRDLELMKNNAALKRIIESEQKDTSCQKSQITPKMVDAVHEMLMGNDKQRFDVQRFSELSLKTNDPRAPFIEFRASLSDQERDALDNYNIEIPCKSSPKSRSSSNEAALAFGQKSDPTQVKRKTIFEALNDTSCVRDFQIYLWKFVLDFKPGTKVPTPITDLAFQGGFQLQHATAQIESSTPRMLKLLGAAPPAQRAAKAPDLNDIAEGDEELQEEPPAVTPRASALPAITEDEDIEDLPAVAPRAPALPAITEEDEDEEPNVEETHASPTQ